MIGDYNLSKQNIEGKKKRGDSQLANEHTQGDEHTQGAVPCLTEEACNEEDATEPMSILAALMLGFD